MKRTLLCVALASVIGSANAGPASEIDSNLVKVGDGLQVGIPLAALGLTFLLDDSADAEEAGAGFRENAFGFDASLLRMNGSPRHDLLLAVGRTELATYTLKYGIDAERPNGGGQSFPSGHTSMAFAGAEFIRKEYGGYWGIPAYLAASYVGWSRVESRNHWTADVLAGAAIGVFSNHDALAFSLPFGHLSVAPSLGVSPNFTAFAPPDSISRAMLDEPQTGFMPGLRFELRF